MTPGDRFRKIRKRASQIVRQHPGKKYQTALKEAGKEFRGKGTAGAKKKKSPAKKGHHKAAKSRGRMGAVPDTPSQSKLKSQLVRSLEEQAAWALLAHKTAKAAKDRNANGKKAREVLRKLQAAKSV